MTILEVEKKLCGDCARWKLLTEEDRAFMGIPEYVSIGRCTHGQQMMEDYDECICVHAFQSITEQLCTTCSKTDCPEFGKTNQGCRDWRGK